jgi:hypothetical protein
MRPNRRDLKRLKINAWIRRHVATVRPVNVTAGFLWQCALGPSEQRMVVYRDSKR